MAAESVKPPPAIEDAGKPIVDWIACRCGGRMSLHEHAIFHSLPYCEQFLNMEPSAYVRWVRLGYQAVIPKQEN